MAKAQIGTMKPVLHTNYNMEMQKLFLFFFSVQWPCLMPEFTLQCQLQYGNAEALFFLQCSMAVFDARVYTAVSVHLRGALKPKCPVLRQNMPVCSARLRWTETVTAMNTF